ncbi:MAG: dihydropteroate synthase [Candidatus Eisenbacteria bacterium]|nr:dihydropteroate synthase [Candidatus Eisenbacteria bacterium]
MTNERPFRFDDPVRPLLIGERTNVLGSRRFREVIEADRWEDAAGIAAAQIRAGAGMIDICVQSVTRDESADMERLMEALLGRPDTRVPVLIDSTDADVMERALGIWPERCVLNSAQPAEPERAARLAEMARERGAAVVAGLIDIEGPAVTAERKRAAAREAYRLLVDEGGLTPESLWWDALVFPCASGDPSYDGAAAATLEAVAFLKSEYPGTSTVLGISNVSFGLPPAGRDAVNALFFRRAAQKGLDAAILNPARLPVWETMDEEDLGAAEEALFPEGDPMEALIRFTRRFREKKPIPSGR